MLRNYQSNLGNLKCRVCGASFQYEIHHLSDPIDVYSEWIDQTESVNKAVKQDKDRDRDDEEGREEEELGAGREED